MVIGLGIEKKIETGKCWIYFADPEMPCYRATYFSHYSAFNVPGGDTERYSSLMCEMSYKVGEIARSGEGYRPDPGWFSSIGHARAGGSESHGLPLSSLRTVFLPDPDDRA